MKNIHYLAISLVILFVLPTITIAFAEETKEYINRRALIWNEFFRTTTAAFVVGAVVSGTLIWLIWRFRESHPKNKTPTKWETGESH
jgi:heme/copper-type cytochrome/quinol oxidase subunit 2